MTVDDLINLTRLNTPSAPEALIRLRLIEAIDDFIDRTNCWTTDIELASVAGQEEYTLVAPDHSQEKAITKVVVDGCEISEYGYRLTNDGNLQLLSGFIVGEADKTITVSVVLIADGTGIYPEWLFERRKQAFIAGASATLMNTPNTAWFAPQAAQGYQKRFFAGVNKEMKRQGPSKIRG